MGLGYLYDLESNYTLAFVAAGIPPFLGALMMIPILRAQKRQRNVSGQSEITEHEDLNHGDDCDCDNHGQSDGGSTTNCDSGSRVNNNLRNAIASAEQTELIGGSKSSAMVIEKVVES